MLGNIISFVVGAAFGFVMSAALAAASRADENMQ